MLFLGKTYEGSAHDFRMFKEEFTQKKSMKLAVYKDFNYWVDLGYQGIKKWWKEFENIFIPHKKPRKSDDNPAPELTEEERLYNTYVGQTRIRGEHAIGSIKNFRITSHKFRGRKDGLTDDVMVVATAIHNFKLLF